VLKRSHHTIEAIKGEEEINVYLFGGLNEQNKPTNTLYHLRIELKDEESELLDYTYKDGAILRLVKDHSGKAPIARSNHVSKLISKNKYMLIYGGRNDYLY